MNLTGECKKAFENWYMNIYHKKFTLNHLELIQATHLNRLGVFNCMPENMQYGVLVDFFDSVGLCIEISIDYTRQGYGTPLYQWEVNQWNIDSFGHKDLVRTRKEARTAAITKANELYNEQSKNKKTITK